MGKNAKLKEKQKWSHEKLHLDNARKLRGIYFIDREDTEFKETIKNARKKLETSVALAMPCKTSRTCNNLVVHKFIPMPQAMKIPAAKAAVDKEWEKLEKVPAWNITKVRNKSEVIAEARTKGAKVHFASLMDICHLKNAELEAKHKKCKGRVVLRGDIVKDDSGSSAVFTEHQHHK